MQYLSNSQCRQSIGHYYHISCNRGKVRKMYLHRQAFWGEVGNTYRTPPEGALSPSPAQTPVPSPAAPVNKPLKNQFKQNGGGEKRIEEVQKPARCCPRIQNTCHRTMCFLLKLDKHEINRDPKQLMRPGVRDKRLCAGSAEDSFEKSTL